MNSNIYFIVFEYIHQAKIKNMEGKNKNGIYYTKRVGKFPTK